ncbi:MAG: MFS transporter [Gammaproteobacteria bacterium]|nr:MAG: MFS transporter [Gammaproteobacteria bacterium]
MKQAIDKKKAWATLTACMLISLLGTAGIALPYPVLAPYFLDSPANALNQFMSINPKLLLGIALALYPLGLLIGSSFLGALSDHYGRRLVLLVSLTGSVIGYLLTVFAVYDESYLLFLFSRLFTGICEGNISIARAMAVELHPVIERGRALSLVYATTYAGWLVGPLAGGYLMLLGTEHVFLAAAGAMIVCIVVVMLTIKDGNQKKLSKGSLLKTINEENSFRLLKHKEVRPIFIYYFIYSLGINTFYEFYPVFFVEKYRFASDDIAWITVLLTATMIISSAFVSSHIVKFLGTFKSLTISVIALGSLIILQPFVGLTIIYSMFVLAGFLIALNNTVTPTYMSQRFGKYGQGKVMGLQTAMFCLANVIISLLGSLLAILSITATMVMAGVLILISIGWFITIKETELSG